MQTKLAGPAAVGKLARRVGRKAGQSEQRNLLETCFKRFVGTWHITEARECFAESVQRLGLGDASRPRDPWPLLGPPPIQAVAGRPSDAVVCRRLRAGHLIPGPD